MLANITVASQRMVVREVQFSGMSLIMPEITLGPLEGKLLFTPAGQLERAWFAMNEQKVMVVLLPQKNRHFALQLKARDWMPPPFLKFPRLLIDDFQVEGVLGERDFVAQKFSIALRGIHASGSAKLELSDCWQMQAMLTHADASLEPLMALFGKTIKLTGALSAKGIFISNASSLGALKDNLQFSNDVLVKHATAHVAADFQRLLVLDQIKARVVLWTEGLEAKLYGGMLYGTANINRKNTMLVADVAAREIAMQPLVEALSNEVLFTGSMEGETKISMRLDEFKKFPADLQLAAQFHLRNGVLTKVDLVQAASNPGMINAEGGTIRFDDLTGSHC